MLANSPAVRGTPASFANRPGDVPCQPATPSDLLRQLEALAGTLEDSFTATEHILSVSPSSPRAMATLQAEKARRQHLLSQISKLVAASGVNSSGSSAGVDETQISLRPSADAGCIKASDLSNEVMEDEAGGTEWKHATLVRLRKFLRRQYRARKNKVVDSAVATSDSIESMSDERAQLQQLAADIKSIELEIGLLSNMKTVVQHGKKCASGSAGRMSCGTQSDSARSQRDTVKRILGSCGSMKGSASRARGTLSGEKLAKLPESDEPEAVSEGDGNDELSEVRRNLLELYAEHTQTEDAGAGLVSESEITHVATVSASTSVLKLSCVSGLPEEKVALVPIGSAGEDMIGTFPVFQNMDSTSPVQEEERETNSSPCKISRLLLQRKGLPVEKETNSSPSKIHRMQRGLLLSGNASGTWSASNVPFVPAGAATSCVQATNQMAVPAREAWSDVDLARWAAVNCGTVCPSPVHVAPGVPSTQPSDPKQPKCQLQLLSTISSHSIKDIDKTQGDAKFEALAASRFSVLEDKDAVRHRSLAGIATAGAPVAVDWSVSSDVEGNSLTVEQCRVEETISSQDTSTTDDDALLRTIKKILNGPGSTPARDFDRAHALVRGGLQTDKHNIDDISLECLAALRSSPFLDGPVETGSDATSAMPLEDPNSFSVGENVCGQARLDSRSGSEETDPANLSDMLLQSVDASGSLAAAALQEPDDTSLLEGTSLLEDFEALPVNKNVGSVQLVPYVFAATPQGQPSAPVEKALLAEFDMVHRQAGDRGEPVELDSTPMGEPSAPVVKSLLQMFDQCLMTSSAAEPEPGSTSPGKAARKEGGSASPLRSVAKRLSFLSDSDQSPLARKPMASEAALPVSAKSGDKANPAVSTHTDEKAVIVKTTRPMSAVLARPAKPGLGPRPFSATAARMPAAASALPTLSDGDAAPNSKVAAYRSAVAVASGTSSWHRGAGAPHAAKRVPTMAWGATKSASEESRGNWSSFAGRAQAKGKHCEPQVTAAQREVRANVRLAPKICSPKEGSKDSSPLALVCSSAVMTSGTNGNGKTSNRPPSAPLPRTKTTVVPGRAISVSPPHRQEIESSRQGAKKDAMPSQRQARFAAAAAATMPSGCILAQQLRSPPSSSSSANASAIKMPNTLVLNDIDAVRRGSGAASGGGNVTGLGGARAPQALLSNKMDLTSSMRLARRAQTNSVIEQASGSALEGPRRTAAHDLKPINCLPSTRIATDEASTTGALSSALQATGSEMGLIGGKRVVVPIVTGAGVLSKQPSRLPPRSAVMCLEDTNVTAQKDNALQDAQQIPAERELPSLPGPDRTSAAVAGGLSTELMQLLREAASERLASYRVAAM